MRTTAFVHRLRSFRPVALAAMMAAGASLSSHQLAADRFIVPVPDSPPAPAPSAPSSSSGSSSSDSSSSSTSSSSPSDSGSSSSSSSSSSTDSRFIVPVPGQRSSPGNAGRGYNPGSYRHDPYSSICYYWDGRYYYGDGYYYSPFGGEFGFDRSSLPLRSNYPPASGGNRRPIFFPPDPPPLDTPIPAPPAVQSYWAPPDELAAFVNDPFYAPLSTRLAERNLTDALRRRLDAYQTAKVELQEQLHRKLAALSSSDAETKANSLAAFAREQTPRIVALEATAEQFRADFLRSGLVGLFSGTGDWNEHRTWRVAASQLGDNRESLIRKFWVARAAVFYQDGLSAAQRRLLREVAVELQAQAFKPAGSAPTSDETLFFFSPDTARVRLPKDMSPELVAKVAAYQSEKSRLKSELRDTLFQRDAATKSARAQALKQFATAQAPRIAALESMAENIRRTLATHSLRSVPVPGVALPPGLAARVIGYREEHRRLQEAIHAKLQEIGRILPATQFTISEASGGPRSEYRLKLEFSTTVSNVRKRLVQQTIDAFNKEHRKQVANLEQQHSAIRTGMTDFLSIHSEVAQGKSVESLLHDYTVASIQMEARPLYETYRVAVFQPGLSAEQRRLLLDAALRQLDLPLPSGELQP